MADNTVIFPAYIDEAEAHGLVRELKPERDHEFGLMSALLFEPDGHAKAIQAFTPAFEAFQMPRRPARNFTLPTLLSLGTRLGALWLNRFGRSILRTDQTARPMAIYAARRLRLARAAHDRDANLQDKAKASRRSAVKIIGENRPSDARIEDDLIISLALRLDAFAEDMAGQVHDVRQVDLLFDETDLAERYEASVQRTREVSKNIATVKGWDPTQSARVEGKIAIKVEPPSRVDTKFIGGIHVLGKAHPLVLAADIVANHLAHHLKQLPADAPLNAPSSVEGWVLRDRAWGVMNGASEDLF